MKIILRILTILLVGALVAGGTYLIAQNTTLVSATNNAPSFGNMPDMPAGDISELPAPPEGTLDHDVAPLSHDLFEVSASLAKIAGITILVLLIQKVYEQLKKWRVPKPAM